MDIFTKTKVIPRFIMHSSEMNICYTKALNRVFFTNKTWIRLGCTAFGAPKITIATTFTSLILRSLFILSISQLPASGAYPPPSSPAEWVLQLTTRKNLKINPLLPKMIHRLMKSHMRCLQTYQLLYKLLFLLLLLLDVGHQFSLSYKSLLQSLHQHKVSVKMILQYLQCWT